MSDEKAKEEVVDEAQGQVDITKVSLSDLKVMAYDQMAAREAADRNLNVINGEIAKRLRGEQ